MAVERRRKTDNEETMDNDFIRQLFEISRKNSESLIRIETLLVGENDSGLCGRVKAIEIELKESPEKKRNFWIGLSGVVAAAIAVIISVFKRQ